MNNVTILGAINEVNATEWNALAGEQNPFLRHEFLSALETHQCVGQRYGWIPQHLILRNHDNTLIGAVPLYLKDNSYGEFVFDWAWADAYHRNGINYYPKLVSSIPYTPATGSRLLIHTDHDYETIASILISGALEHTHRLKISSLHWLFTDNRDTNKLHEAGFMKRLGCQFHWHNKDYDNFDSFLSVLNHGKRKMIRKERRRVSDAEIELEVLDGHNTSESQWHTYHRFYESTFMKLGGYATLSCEFFQQLGQTMADNIVLVMAKHHGKYIASAFCLRGKDTLYGRHWGCDRDYHSLHFEACYYQGIEYCIKHGLKHFEPGAQGEHKISRGFEPTPTWSAHWLENEVFRRAIGEFLDQESQGMEKYIKQLREHLPFRKIQ